MATYKKVTELIGKTPLLELTNYEAKHKLNATILAKLEYFNPAGSELLLAWLRQQRRKESLSLALSS